MLHEREHGSRDARGNWRPDVGVVLPPLIVWPPRPKAALTWVVGYPGFVFPWNALYLAVAAIAWWLFTPSFDAQAFNDAQYLSAGWIGRVLVRNFAIVCIWYSLLHVRLYSRRSQGDRFKYNAKFPGRPSKRFTFGSQRRDNIFWSLASGVPIWTAYEILSYWMFAGGHIPWLRWMSHPVWFVLWFPAIVLFREVHFYATHRLIHQGVLYDKVHSLHHRNTNPSPWSGLAMHPLEHLVYFSGVLVHWVVPSHPFHVLFHLVHLAMAPGPGHTGFDKIELGTKTAVDTNGFAHYLHHKYFEVNYGDGALPLDRWFGSFHDGSAESDERMRRRRSRRLN